MRPVVEAPQMKNVAVSSQEDEEGRGEHDPGGMGAAESVRLSMY
jgi:hypothetical protein